MPKVYSRGCAQCGQTFQSTNPRTRCCSRKCGSAYRNDRLGVSWANQEDDKLADLASTLPFPKLVKAFQSWAKRNGLKPRTKSAIDNRMFKLSLSRKAELDNLKMADFAAILGIPAYQVRVWRNFYNLPVRKASDRATAISLQEFRRWAESHPSHLGGLEVERLEWVLGDLALAERYAALRPHSKAISIRRLDTGETFPSLNKAAASAFLTAKALSHYSRRGHDRFTSGGIEWEVLRNG